jgi:hypothetical protein
MTTRPKTGSFSPRAFGLRLLAILLIVRQGQQFAGIAGLVEHRVGHLIPIGQSVDQPVT